MRIYGWKSVIRVLSNRFLSYERRTAKRRRWRRMSTLPIPRIQWKEYSKERFHTEYVVKNLPCVIEGAIDDWPALTKWQDPEYVINTVGPDRKMAVELVNRKYPTYVYNDSRTFADARVITTFREFAEHCLKHTAPIDGESWYCPQQHHSELNSDFWPPDIVLDPKLLKKAYAWMAQVGAGPGLHLDAVDNVLCHIRGEKRVLLIPPEDTKFCYPRIEGIPNHSQIANVDDKETNDAKFPLFQHTRRYEVVLKTGEALFIPANWWHDTWALTPFNIGVNFFFTTAGGEDFGVSLEEYDLLGLLFLEKFKKMAPLVRAHLVRYFDFANNALDANRAAEKDIDPQCKK